MRTKSASITIDAETYRVIEKLAKLSNKSIPDAIRDLVKKRKTAPEYRITRGVKEISGILKTDVDYKALRDMCVTEKVARVIGDRAESLKLAAKRLLCILCLFAVNSIIFRVYPCSSVAKLLNRGVDFKLL